MSRSEKILEEMRGRPKGWTYDQVKRVLEYYGFETRSKGGSHRLFKHSSGERVGLVDAGSGTLKPVYVEEAVAAIDRTLEDV